MLKLTCRQLVQRLGRLALFLPGADVPQFKVAIFFKSACHKQTWVRLTQSDSADWGHMAVNQVILLRELELPFVEGEREDLDSALVEARDSDEELDRLGPFFRQADGRAGLSLRFGQAERCRRNLDTAVKFVTLESDLR